MLSALLNLGKQYLLNLQTKYLTFPKAVVHSLVEIDVLPPKSKKPVYVVYLHLKRKNKKWRLEVKRKLHENLKYPFDKDVIYNILWCGHAPGNRRQNRITVTNLKYLISPVIPNLLYSDHKKRKEKDFPVLKPGKLRDLLAAHTSLAEDLLSKAHGLEEHEYTKLLEEYFIQVQSIKSQAKGGELWDAYSNLRYSSNLLFSLRDFRLIDEVPLVNVYIPLTEEDEVWFIEVFMSQVLRDRNRRWRMYLRCRYRLYTCMLQIPQYRMRRNFFLEKCFGLYWVPVRQRNELYNLETGIIIL